MNSHRIWENIFIRIRLKGVEKHWMLSEERWEGMMGINNGPPLVFECVYSPVMLNY